MAVSNEVLRVTPGELVRAHRLASGLSLRELCQRTGMALSALWEIETDRKDPHYRTLERIAQGLGKTVHELTAPPRRKDADA